MEREGVWERRGERGGRAQIWEVGVGRWRDGALEEWSSGGASERRGVRGWGGGHSAWTMDEQRWGERERERASWSVEASPSLSLSLLFVSLHSHGSIPPPHPSPSSLLLQGASGTHAPLATPLLLLLLFFLLPLAPSACLPSLHPGGLGQCWRHSRDLQEICLSEKQLVRLSTANVCTLGPPLLLGTARARPS